MANTAIHLILSNSHWTVWTGYTASNPLSHPGAAESLICLQFLQKGPSEQQATRWQALSSSRVGRELGQLCTSPLLSFTEDTHSVAVSSDKRENNTNQRCDPIGLCTILAWCFIKQNPSFSKGGRQRELLAPWVNNAKIFDCFCLSFRRITVRNKSSESCFRKSEQRIRNHNKRWQRGEGATPGAGVSGL